MWRPCKCIWSTYKPDMVYIIILLFNIWPVARVRLKIPFNPCQNGWHVEWHKRGKRNVKLYRKKRQKGNLFVNKPKKYEIVINTGNAGAYCFMKIKEETIAEQFGVHMYIIGYYGICLPESKIFPIIDIGKFSV